MQQIIRMSRSGQKNQKSTWLLTLKKPTGDDFVRARFFGKIERSHIFALLPCDGLQDPVLNGNTDGDILDGLSKHQHCASVRDGVTYLGPNPRRSIKGRLDLQLQLVHRFDDFAVCHRIAILLGLDKALDELDGLENGRVCH